MTDMILAKNNVNDWVQIIVLILVFGGSVFGAIAKKLIRYFGERRAGRPFGSHTPSPQPVPPAQRRSVSRPAFPVAKAMPGAPRARPSQAPSVAPAVPIRPVAPGQAAAPPNAPQRGPVPARSSPTPARTVPAPPRRAEPFAPHHVPVQRSATRARLPRKASTVAASVNAHISAKHSRLEKEATVVDTAVDEHLGALRKRMAERDDAAETALRQTPFGALAVRDLRKAILLNEILSPPIALRGDPMGW